MSQTTAMPANPETESPPGDSQVSTNQTQALPTEEDPASSSDGEAGAEAVKPIKPGPHGPSFVFFGIVAAIGVLVDAITKAWAETTLSELPRHARSIVLLEDRLTFTLAYNKGGAFGMLSNEADFWRKPFFLLISIVAVVFIVSLYRKIEPNQRALRWGLPLVLSGALGNLADRITKGKVVDFIDYRADWVQVMNELILKVNSDWYVSRHWPTFNVADVCICVGVGLMAVDMFLSSRSTSEPEPADAQASRSSS